MNIIANPTPAVVLVTPALAEKWLEQNKRNRSIRKSHVLSLARDMREGNWRFNGDTVRFAKNGDLLDGQHRLSAVVESEATVPMLVIEGLDGQEVQHTIDVGLARTGGDAFAFRGLPYANQQAAVARLAIAVERGANSSNFRPTNAELIRYVEAHPEITDSVVFAAALTTKGYRDCPPTILAYTHMVLSQINAADAVDFWQSVFDMTPIYRGDPAIALARRLADIRRDRQRLSPGTYLSLIYRTWNKRRAMKSVIRTQITQVAGFDNLPTPR